MSRHYLKRKRRKRLNIYIDSETAEYIASIYLYRALSYKLETVFFSCQPGRGIHVKEFIKFRNLFMIEGDINGLYGTPEAKTLFECINHKLN